MAIPCIQLCRAYRHNFREVLHIGELIYKCTPIVRICAHAVYVFKSVSSAMLLLSFFQPFAAQRVLFAYVVAARWLSILLLLRITNIFGRKIIPILNTMKGIAGWVLVFIFVACALFHAQVALSNANANDTIFINFRALLFDIELDQDVRELYEVDNKGTSWVRDLVTLGLRHGVAQADLDLWTFNIFFFSILVGLGIFGLNLLIAVLSEEYNKACQTVELDFYREQCAFFAVELSKTFLLKEELPSRCRWWVRLGLFSSIVFKLPRFLMAARVLESPMKLPGSWSLNADQVRVSSGQPSQSIRCSSHEVFDGMDPHLGPAVATSSFSEGDSISQASLLAIKTQLDELLRGTDLPNS